ncbi:hypothetical protein ACVGWK_03635, partial [Enterobacter sichuanensis]
IPMSAMFSMIVLRMKACPQHSTGKEGVTISLNMLTETIDSERTIRQAERFFIDSNMILNLPDFVSFIFTTKTLPSASLISPIKVRKRQLKIFSVSPDIAASAAPVKIALDFDEDDKPSIQDVMTTYPDLFFNGSEVKPAEPQPDEGEHLSPLDF